MRSLHSIVLPLILSVALPSMAAQTGDTLSYNFSGTFMISSPCTINNNEVMDVVFGNIGVNKVNGVDYKQPIPYVIDCHGAPDDSKLSLTVAGIAASFDTAALATNADGLGIQIQANDQPLTLNQSLDTTLGALSTLKLMAVPVKDPAKTLTEQPFSAIATLKADYQ
ncbi:fimbrial protein [Atlantibacter sp.]|uniref:fimbrial protein n=1 Tax=Atlantibacter sp. TaxID=1903473 RepID=UPI0028A7A3D6|nr:fimbrial protein [Atlantibacter sp.]